MTPQARSGAPFELLRFEAAPVSATLVALELEGRFEQSRRFGRAPVLVVEPGGDARRVELTPIRTVVAGDRWQAGYVAPVEALAPGAHLALGIRGTLLELPAPDEPDDGDRIATLAREANRLRRRLEAAEDEAAAARADAATARADALAESAERIHALEHEVVEAHRVAAADAEQARAAADAALAAATTRAEEAEARAAAAEARVAELETQAAEADAAGAEALTAEMAAAIDAQARAAEAEQELKAAREGIEVLRAELAEERERSQITIAELEREAEEARAEADALRHATAEGPRPGTDDDVAEGVAPDDDTSPADARDDATDETRVVRGAFGDDLDPTRPFSVAEQRDADEDATQPFGARREAAGPREATLRDLLTAHGPESARPSHNVGRWIAVAALFLFAFVLLGLLAGFLG